MYFVVNSDWELDTKFESSREVFVWKGYKSAQETSKSDIGQPRILTSQRSIFPNLNVTAHNITLFINWK